MYVLMYVGLHTRPPPPAPARLQATLSQVQAAADASSTDTATLANRVAELTAAAASSQQELNRREALLAVGGGPGEGWRAGCTNTQGRSNVGGRGCKHGALGV